MNAMELLVAITTDDDVVRIVDEPGDNQVGCKPGDAGEPLGTLRVYVKGHTRDLYRLLKHAVRQRINTMPQLAVLSSVTIGGDEFVGRISVLPNVSRN
jgi:hypothetical protein